MRNASPLVRAAVLAAAAASLSTVATSQAAPAGQTAPASNAVRSVGTVQSVGGGNLSIKTDKGDTVSVSLPDAVRVVQLAPGSTDLKTAQPGTLADITQGDRVLVTGRPGDNGAVTALRVVLMKSSAIAQSNASRQQDWQRRGSGGVVTGVDSATHAIAVTAGTRKETVDTTPSTVFRRYAPGSVKFEEAQVGRLDDIHAGDQVRVRGDKSADGTTITAEEVVSGAFRNVAGTVSKVDAGANTVTVTDLATKKPVTVAFTSESDLRALPPEMAARFAARARGGANGAAGAAGTGAANGTAGSARPTAAGAEGGASARPAYGAGANAGTGTEGGAQRVAGGSHLGGSGGDLSQVIARLPKSTLAELKPGEAVMIVASGDSTAGSSLTAITALSGVEPLLAAAPQGSANSFSISPWQLGGGGEGGESAGPQ